MTGTGLSRKLTEPRATRMRYALYRVAVDLGIHVQEQREFLLKERLTAARQIAANKREVVGGALVFVSASPENRECSWRTAVVVNTAPEGTPTLLPDRNLASALRNWRRASKTLKAHKRATHVTAREALNSRISQISKPLRLALRVKGIAPEEILAWGITDSVWMYFPELRPKDPKRIYATVSRMIRRLKWSRADRFGHPDADREAQRLLRKVLKLSGAQWSQSAFRFLTERRRRAL
jgi:hypothetical protein